MLSARIPRTDYRRLQVAAKTLVRGFNDHVRTIIWEATNKVPLTGEDYAQIQREQQRDIERATAKGRRTKGA